MLKGSDQVRQRDENRRRAPRPGRNVQRYRLSIVTVLRLAQAVLPNAGWVERAEVVATQVCCSDAGDPSLGPSTRCGSGVSVRSMRIGLGPDLGLCGPRGSMRNCLHALKVATRVRIPLGVPAEAAGQRPRQNSRGLRRSLACHPPCHPLASPRTLAERWRVFDSSLPVAGSSGSTRAETRSRALRRGPLRPSTPRGSAMPSARRARGKSSCASRRRLILAGPSATSPSSLPSPG